MQRHTKVHWLGGLTRVLWLASCLYCILVYGVELNNIPAIGIILFEEAIIVPAEERKVLEQIHQGHKGISFRVAIQNCHSEQVSMSTDLAQQIH